MDRVGAPARGEPLSVDHRHELAALIAGRRSPLAEYSFANLYLFRRRHRYRFVRTPTPHITGVTYDGVSHAMPLTAIDSAAAIDLLHHADCLFPIDVRDLPALQEPLQVSCCEDDSDYLYDARRLAGMAGPALKNKRAQASAFARAFRPELVLGHADFGRLAAEVLARWLSESGKDPAATDYHPCAEAIAMADTLGLEHGVVLVDGEPQAFLLAGALADGSKAVHFAKGRRAPPGVYPWLFSRYAAVCGVDRLNFEQDLGKPGFRQAKRALAPVGQGLKYRVSLRGRPAGNAPGPGFRRG